MGLGIRVFLLDGDNIKIISHAKFERLWQGDEKESTPEYAGKRIRYAIAYLETQNRKPVYVSHIDRGFIDIDQEGKFDPKEFDEKRRYASQMIQIEDEDVPANVIDKSSDFTVKKFSNLYSWELTPDELDRIINLIF